MGNTVCTDSSPLQLQELRKAVSSKLPLPQPTSEITKAFAEYNHSVRAFAFTMGSTGGANHQAVPLNQTSIAFDASASYLVLHIKRDGEAPLPPVGSADWATEAHEAFTPRGLTDPFSIDLVGRRWRSKALRENFNFAVYVYRGKRSHPLLASVALSMAMQLERHIIHSAATIDALFHNRIAASASALGVPATVTFQMDGSPPPAIPDKEMTLLYRHNALLRDFHSIDPSTLKPAKPQHVDVSVSGLKPAAQSTAEVNENKPQQDEVTTVRQVPSIASLTLDPVAVDTQQNSPPTIANLAAVQPSPGRAEDPEFAAEAEADANKKLRRAAPIVQEVLPFLFVGGEVASQDRRQLSEKRITHIVNCAAIALNNSFEEQFEYTNLFLCDSPDETLVDLFPQVIDLIENARVSGGKVFVHCHQGVSRSCTFVIAYVMWHKGMCYDEAYKLVRAARDVCHPNPGFYVQLLDWEKWLAKSPIPTGTAWRYGPYNKDYPFPMCYRSAKPNADGKVVIDPRCSYVVVGEQRRVMFLRGEHASSDAREEAQAAMNGLLRFGAYAGKPRESTTNNGRVVRFVPQDFAEAEIVMVSEAKAIASVVPVAQRRDESVDALFPDDFEEKFVEWRKQCDEKRKGAPQREKIRAQPADSQDNTVPPLGSRGGLSVDETTATSTAPEEDQGPAEDAMTVIEYPFDGEPIEVYDYEDLMPDGCYAIRMGRVGNRAEAEVLLWMGGEFAENPELGEDAALENYDSNLRETPFHAPMRVIVEGDEPDDLMMLF